MKTQHYLATTALLLTAVAPQSSAADVTVDIVSIAPRNPDAVIAQIELNVLLKQYEKLLTQIEDTTLQHEIENDSISSEATEDQKKQAEERHVKQNKDQDRESRALQDRAVQCRARIKEIISDANKRAAAFEKEQREAKQTTGQSQPNVGTLTLSKWSNIIRQDVIEQILKGWKTERDPSCVIGGSLMPEVVSFTKFLEGEANTSPTNRLTLKPDQPKDPANVQPTPAK